MEIFFGESVQSCSSKTVQFSLALTKETGEVFLGISKDTKSDFNSTNMKLAANWHPNKRLQELWNKYGSEGFELSVIKVLKYDDPHEDHTAKLESLREQCLAADPNARRIWR